MKLALSKIRSRNPRTTSTYNILHTLPSPMQYPTFLFIDSSTYRLSNYVHPKIANFINPDFGGRLPPLCPMTLPRLTATLPQAAYGPAGVFPQMIAGNALSADPFSAAVCRRSSDPLAPDAGSPELLLSSYTYHLLRSDVVAFICNSI